MIPLQKRRQAEGHDATYTARPEACVLQTTLNPSSWTFCQCCEQLDRCTSDHAASEICAALQNGRPTVPKRLVVGRANVVGTGAPTAPGRRKTGDSTGPLSKPGSPFSRSVHAASSNVSSSDHILARFLLIDIVIPSRLTCDSSTPYSIHRLSHCRVSLLQKAYREANSWMAVISDPRIIFSVEDGSSLPKSAALHPKPDFPLASFYMKEPSPVLAKATFGV